MIKRLTLIILIMAAAASLFGCGGGGSSASLPDGVNPGVVSRVELMATSYVNQTNGYCYLKTKAIDGNGVPIPNRQVVWTNLSTTGVLDTTTSMTNQNGIATATLYSTTSGFATVQAEVNADNTGTEKIRDRKTVYFTPFDMVWPGAGQGTLNLASLTLDVDSDNDGVYNETSDFILFQPSGKTDAVIRATVTDSTGAPLMNSAVTFGADSPEVTFPAGSDTKAPVVHTNAQGQASVLARVLPSILRTYDTTVNITAEADNNTVDVVTLFLKPVTVTSITVSASPTTVQGGGTITTTTSTGTTTTAVAPGTADVVATVTTSVGVPPPSGTNVRFTTNLGTIDAFAATDANGIAKAKYTAPNPVLVASTATVTASAGGQSGSTNINVTVPTAGPPALSVIPASQTIANPVVGNTARYTILGGTAPYSVFSDSPAVVQATIAGSVLTAMVAGVPTADQTVTLSVYDSLGAKVDVKLVLQIVQVAQLTVTPNPPTPVMGIPNPDGNAADDLTFSISGGTGPYTITSSNPGVIASPGLLGAGVTQFTVDPNSVNVSTQVTLFVSDSVGATVSVPVTVNPLVLGITLDKFNVIGMPVSANGAANLVTATVMGGTGPYIVTSNNPALTPSGTWTSGAAPFSFSFFANNVGAVTTVTLTVFDNAGANATATLQIFPQTTGLVISVNKPDVIGLINPDGNATDDVTFSVTGGSPPYLISDGGTCTPNPGLSPAAPWSIVVNGGTVTIDPGRAVGASVTCTLTVTDNVGAQTNTTFTVHP
ncbi:MAG: Ig-like domain-containing protein [Nitrospirae bacterium]|nr:Ig-like domain-containing protein [Nitrospirota bacterium]